MCKIWDDVTLVDNAKNPESLTGKRREIRDRGERFLAIARRIFVEEGYHAVTIDRIAHLAGFSKGTVYQRFACKEELLVELAVRARRDMIDIMARIDELPLRPRERMVAVGYAVERYADLYSNSLRIMAVIEEQTVLDRVPPEQQERTKALDMKLFKILAGIVRDAVEQGDLRLPPACAAEAIALSLWALIDGWGHAVRGAVPLNELGLGDAVVDVLRSAQFLMDGYGWRPLYRDWDYRRMEDRVEALLSRSAPGPPAAPCEPETESTNAWSNRETRMTAEGGP